MNYTQNKKIEQVTADTLIIGIDIGSDLTMPEPWTDCLTEGYDMMETDMDRLIQYAMQESPEGITDEELEFYRQTKPILRDEILTCYRYLEKKRFA